MTQDDAYKKKMKALPRWSLHGLFRDGVTFAPTPKGVTFAPTPLSFPLTVSFNLLG